MKKIIAFFFPLVLFASPTHAKPPEALSPAACDALIPYIRGYDEPVPCPDALVGGVVVGSPNHAEYKHYVGLCYVGNPDAIQNPDGYVLEVGDEEYRKLDETTRRQVKNVTLYYSASQKDYVPVAYLSDEDNAILDHVYCLRYGPEELAKAESGQTGDSRLAACARLPEKNWQILRSLPVPTTQRTVTGDDGKERNVVVPHAGRPPVRVIRGIPFRKGNQALNIALYRAGKIPPEQRVPPLAPPSFLGLKQGSPLHQSLGDRLKDLETLGAGKTKENWAESHEKLMETSRKTEGVVQSYLRDQGKSKKQALGAVQDLTGAQNAYRQSVLKTRHAKYWEILVGAVMKDGGCLNSHFGPNYFCKGQKGLELEACMQKLRNSPSLVSKARELANDPQFGASPDGGRAGSQLRDNKQYPETAPQTPGQNGEGGQPSGTLQKP